MDQGVVKHLETILREYPNTDGYIQKREMLLTYNYHEQLESKVLKECREGDCLLALSVVEDRHLTQLKKNQRCIKYCLDSVDSLTVKVIQLLYFEHKTWRTMENVGLAIGLSKASVSRHRNLFFELLAAQLGF